MTVEIKIGRDLRGHEFALCRQQGSTSSWRRMYIADARVAIATGIMPRGFFKSLVAVKHKESL